MAAKIGYKAGTSYSYLTLTGNGNWIREKSVQMVEAICVCGKIRFYRYPQLCSGQTASCGCKRGTHRMTLAGMQRSPIYTAWNNMKSRCYNKKHDSYCDYGEKGIIVCEEWIHDYFNFYNWSMANGWQKGLTIDRIFGHLNYSPDNCRWADYFIQNRNTSRNVYVEAFGEKKCMAEWSKDSRCVVSNGTFYSRVKKHKWEVEKALITPSIITEGSTHEKKNAKFIEYKGERKRLKDWANALGFSYKLLLDRLRNKWSVEKSFETPLKSNIHGD